RVHGPPDASAARAGRADERRVSRIGAAARLGHSLAAFVLTSGVALAAVAVVVALSDSIAIGPALLAFAPGGLEAMMALSFALNLEPAYVATH
ncbi:AbrB family transcriptional regulator, partial [Mycobacterium tuberculosis]|nr:AbrB family transcriptional regulator [Mycobacterium tuberculosis]